MLLLFGAIAIAMWYFTSLYLQNVLGYSALRAGLGQTPAAVTFVVTARLAAALLPRTGARPLVLAGCGCFLAGFGWLTQAHADSGYLTSVLGPTLLIAAGIGLTFPTLTAAATADVPEGDAGITGGLASTTTQIGASVGLAVLATAASARTRMEAGGHSPAAALAAGYDLVFLMAAGLGLAIAVISVLLPQARAAARAGRPGLLRPSERAAGNPAPDRGQRDDHHYRRDSGQPAPGLPDPRDPDVVRAEALARAGDRAGRRTARQSGSPRARRDGGLTVPPVRWITR
jgi:MFS family permease